MFWNTSSLSIFPMKLIAIVLIVCLSEWSAGNSQSPSASNHVLPQPLCRHPVLSGRVLKVNRYFGARIPYLPNSTATFQIRLLVSGDVNPNQGPTKHDDDIMIDFPMGTLSESCMIDLSCLNTIMERVDVFQNRYGEISLNLVFAPNNLIVGIKRGKRGGRRKQRKMTIITTASVNKERSISGENGVNKYNLGHLTDTSVRQLEVRDNLPPAIENY